MSSFDPARFAEQATEKLRQMSDDEFEAKLRERCPELVEEPGPPPPDAMGPGFGPEPGLEELSLAVGRAAAALSELEAVFRRLSRRKETPVAEQTSA